MNENYEMLVEEIKGGLEQLATLDPSNQGYMENVRSLEVLWKLKLEEDKIALNRDVNASSSNQAKINSDNEKKKLEIEEKNEETVSLDNDFSSLDKSDELPEVPQATALFNAIMNSSANKAENQESGNAELNTAAAKDDDFFFSSTSLQSVSDKEDDATLFKENDSDIFKDIKPAEPVEEPEEPAEEDEDTKPTFIERMIGIRGRKKKEENEDAAEEVVKLSDEDNSDMQELSSDELDIPSFLRRK